MKLVNLRTLGCDREAECVHKNGSMNELEAGDNRILKRQQRGDRLTARVRRCASGWMCPARVSS